MSTWIYEGAPALDGLTPRAAARHPQKEVVLESLLRQFEHDADLAAAGSRPLNEGTLRDLLGMRDGVTWGAPWVSWQRRTTIRLLSAVDMAFAVPWQ